MNLRILEHLKNPVIVSVVLTILIVIIIKLDGNNHIKIATHSLFVIYLMIFLHNKGILSEYKDIIENNKINNVINTIQI